MSPSSAPPTAVKFIHKLRDKTNGNVGAEIANKHTHTHTSKGALTPTHTHTHIHTRMQLDIETLTGGEVGVGWAKLGEQYFTTRRRSVSLAYETIIKGITQEIRCLKSP